MANTTIPPEFVQPIIEAASEACGAFWNDSDERRLHAAMRRLADLFRAIRVTNELQQDTSDAS